MCVDGLFLKPNRGAFQSYPTINSNTNSSRSAFWSSYAADKAYAGAEASYGVLIGA